jgi:transcriptional regulator with XRE-family HTH domain
MPSISDALRQAREKLNLSQRELATRLGVSPANLADIEHGRRGVSLSRAAQFGEAMGLGQAHFVQVALQARLDDAGLPYTVKVAPKIAPQTGKR